MYAPVDDTVVCDAALQELMIMFRTEFAKNARTIAELDEAAKNMQEAAKKQEADFDEEIRIAKAQSEKEIQEAYEELSNAANNSSMFKNELLELEEALERAVEEDVKTRTLHKWQGNCENGKQKCQTMKEEKGASKKSEGAKGNRHTGHTPIVEETRTSHGCRWGTTTRVLKRWNE